ncbi:MAG: 23S rRNA (adenine(2503)-C(2))-methyltransferase RlmN [Candidatus Binatia bacterium]
MLPNVKDLTADELGAWLVERGQPRFRARQILQWLFQKGALSFVEMSDLSKELRDVLSRSFLVTRPQTVRRSESADGTRKLLLRLADGSEIETVVIPMEREAQSPRLTLCISSQVGCGMGCAFCATATLGLRRSLRASEIVDQVLEARREVRGAGSPPTGGHDPLNNIVFMGMGEPLHNYDEVVRAIGILTAEWGPGFSPRRITVSTVGLVPQMRRLLEDTRVNLAISLSATTEATRGRLMPVNRKYPLEEILRACRELPLPRRRRITFEYVMLRGENDSLTDAARLGRLLRGIPSKVNLIPFNPFPQTPFAPTQRPAIEAFRAELLRQGIHATVRESRGQDIQAACGQLAAVA